MPESLNNIPEVTLSWPLASAILAVFILGCLLVLPQRAGSHPVQPGMARR
jgi:hypothetical protein